MPLLALNTELLITGTGTFMAIGGVMLATWAVRSRKSPKPRTARRAAIATAGILLVMIGLYIAMKTYIESSGWGQWVRSAIDWLLPLVGTTLMVVGAAVLVWGLFADRAAGRRRCPRCWYDMDAVPGLTCPECGRIARTERRLLRTRRKYRWALLGLLLALLGTGQFAAPWFRRGQWARWVPTRVLIVFMPSASPYSPVLRELDQRLLDSQRSVNFNGFELPHIRKLPEHERRQFVRTALGALTGNSKSAARELMWEVLPETLTPADAPQAEPLVLTALSDKSEVIRLAAITTLRKVNGFDPEKSMVAVLAMFAAPLIPDAGTASLREAIGYLGEHGKDPRAIPQLISVLNTAPATNYGFSFEDESLSLAAIRALARCGPDAHAALPFAVSTRQAYGGRHSGVVSCEPLVEYATRVIQGSGTSSEVLRAMLADPAVEHRRFAAQELGDEPGSDDSASDLLGALSDPDTLVRLLAADSLLQMQRQTPGARQCVESVMRSIALVETRQPSDPMRVLTDVIRNHRLEPEPLAERVRALVKQISVNPSAWGGKENWAASLLSDLERKQPR